MTDVRELVDEMRQAGLLAVFASSPCPLFDLGSLSQSVSQRSVAQLTDRSRATGTVQRQVRQQKANMECRCCHVALWGASDFPSSTLATKVFQEHLRMSFFLP